MAKEYIIGDFLKRIKRPVELIGDFNYKLVTIKLFHKGVVMRELKRGGEIKSGMYLIKKGDFILSGIDARNGAFGIVPEELDNAIVTNDFWYFEIDEEIISKRLFLELTATNWFDEICKRGSEGTTQRIRLQKDKFFNQTVYLPEKKEQQSMLDLLLQFKSRKTELFSEISSQAIYLTQLRQSILHDAVKGKLVSQNTKDEPATELLKHIKAEKEKLIKQGKIKKEKPLPPITESEIPYELPKGWAWCRLGMIGETNIGLTYKPTQVKESGIPVLRANNIQNYEIVYSELVHVDAPVRPNQFANIGDIVICVRSGSSNLIGKAAVVEKQGMSFGAFMSIYRSVCNPFIFHFMRSEFFKRQIDDKKSTGINQLTQEVLKNILFPIPPLAEQNRIVKKVNELMALCASLEKEIAKGKQETDYLLNAILRETFITKPVKEYSQNEIPISIAAEQ